MMYLIDDEWFCGDCAENIGQSFIMLEREVPCADCKKECAPGIDEEEEEG